jgi:hypothetical protein
MMFEQMLRGMQTATEANLALQQDLFKKWVSFWPTVPAAPVGANEQVQKAQKKWIEFVNELIQKQREVLAAQFSAGLKSFEDAFRLAEAKSPEELRAKTLELWEKQFECLRRAYEAQVSAFQTAATKWTELFVKAPA